MVDRDSPPLHGRGPRRGVRAPQRRRGGAAGARQPGERARPARPRGLATVRSPHPSGRSPEPGRCPSLHRAGELLGRRDRALAYCGWGWAAHRARSSLGALPRGALGPPGSTGRRGAAAQRRLSALGNRRNTKLAADRPADPGPDLAVARNEGLGPCHPVRHASCPPPPRRAPARPWERNQRSRSVRFTAPKAVDR